MNFVKFSRYGNLKSEKKSNKFRGNQLTWSLKTRNKPARALKIQIFQMQIAEEILMESVVHKNQIKFGTVLEVYSEACQAHMMELALQK